MENLILIKLVVGTVLAVWSLISTINNIVSFKLAKHSIVVTMGMKLLDDAPPINTPLRNRRMESEALAGVIMTGIVLCQIVATALLAVGAYYLIGAWIGGGSAALGISWTTAGLAALCLLWMSMMIGGIWFAYWFRQPQLHTLHIAFFSMTMIAAILMNS